MQKITNQASATLNAGITSGATSVPLSSGQGAQFPAAAAGGDHFYIVMSGAAGFEIALVTARASDTLTVTRGQDGTTAKAFSAGEVVEMRPCVLGQYDFLANVTRVRQTVLNGPVDSSGLSAFGGSTGGTTVTASAFLTVSGAYSQFERMGTITNPAWTGLSTNGTMYLFVDVAQDGSCTTGSTTLAPVYQWGGTYSVTNLQNTFNIQEMTMKVGNGSTASQVCRVFVGEVTVAAGVVSTIVWYALMGRYDSGWTATLPTSAGAQPVATHRIGVTPELSDFIVECTTTDLGWGVGSRLKVSQLWTSDGSRCPITLLVTRTVVVAQIAATTGGIAALNSAGAAANLTAASWKYKFTAQRGW